MLVLQRQLHETICIGDDITITVVRIQGDKIKLGIVAPKSIPVDRLEVKEAIARDGRRIAAGSKHQGGSR